MTDIDFDELDRAITSFSKPSDASKPEGTQESKPLHAQKHSGSLIDVVHPSGVAFSRPPSLSHVGKKQETSLKKEDLSSVDKKDTSEPPEVAETPAESLPKDTSYRPLSTPFLTDAKVEKRPLGLSEPKPADEEEKPVDEEKLGTEKGAVETPEKTDEPTEADLQRPEFEEDVVKIEAEELSRNKEEKEPEAEKPEPFKAVELEEPDTPEEKPENKHRSDEHSAVEPHPHITALLASSSVVSIPQQYKSATPAPDPVSDQPLFNAEHYRQTPAESAAHHTGKTSLLQWVVIVVGLLLLGAVLGTVAFVFATGQSL